MCLLTFCKPGATPTKEQLQISCRNNPDGFGFAIVDGDQIIVGKDMNATKVIQWFFKERHEHPDGPALFHSRVGTHGVKTVDNAHPFYVNQTTVLAHNGILSKTKTWHLDEAGKSIDPRSDTRIFAEDYMPAMGGAAALDSPQMVSLLEDWIGYNNKIVVLTVDPQAKNNWYILQEDRGHWKDDIWWSNGSYEEHKPVVVQRTSRTVQTLPSYTRDWWERDLEGFVRTAQSWVAKDNIHQHPDDIWEPMVGWVPRKTASKKDIEYFDTYDKPRILRALEARDAARKRAEAKKSFEEAKHGGKETVTTYTRNDEGGQTVKKYKKGEDGSYHWVPDPPKVVEVVGEIEDDDETGRGIFSDICPTCGNDLTAYDKLHDICMTCYTCLECENELRFCECEEKFTAFAGIGW